MDTGKKQVAALVAQRLCDLLLEFPSAAIGGVQWRVLVRRYEDRYGVRLDPAALGQCSAVGAATALLWDVLRLVSREDPENPVVAIEDAVALTPQPGSIGTWPSLYATLRVLVQGNGTLEPPAKAAGDHATPVRCLLLSQLKPMLQNHWHANFDDTSMSFVSEEGTFTKMKKMKHLLQAVLKWRDQRVEWQQSKALQPTEVDDALHPRLELIASKTHNDLILRCPVEATVVAPTAAAKAAVGEPAGAAATSPRSPAPKEQPRPSPQQGCCTEPQEAADAEHCGGLDLERELASLRAENAALRRSNERLLWARDGGPEGEGGTCRQLPLLFMPLREQEPAVVDGFDDPFEPPPQRLHSWAGTPTATSTATPGSTELFDGASTRASITPLSGFDLRSGAMTPAPPASLSDAVCALVPMWFSWMPTTASLLGDRSDIPEGIVDRLRLQFESAAGPDTVPPMPQVWFAKQ